jgi:tRNA pseudouridine55 synthase
VGGVLLLDKPAGLTSTRALAKARRLLGERKGGHTGTLDPFATGLLPLAFGEATKFSRFLIDARKGYRATLCLGRTSTTGDPEGVLSHPAAVTCTDQQIADVLRMFVGVQQQVPPMHSALHHEGRRLYELAREGIEVERAPRTIEIFGVDLVEKCGEKLVISVKCSKGTYIRTLAQDIGARLGCGAYLTGLHRTEVGPFHVDAAVSLEALEAAGTRAVERLLAPEVLVEGLPRRILAPAEAAAIVHGQSIAAVGAVPGETALFSPGPRFLGVGLADGAGRLTPVRLLAAMEGADGPDFA